VLGQRLELRRARFLERQPCIFASLEETTFHWLGLLATPVRLYLEMNQVLFDHRVFFPRPLTDDVTGVSCRSQFRFSFICFSPTAAAGTGYMWHVATFGPFAAHETAQAFAPGAQISLFSNYARRTQNVSPN
jgi:hypothetical protein